MVRFQNWLVANPTASISQKLDELRSIQTMSSLRPADRIIIYLGAVFNEHILTEKQVQLFVTITSLSDVNFF